MSSYLIFWNIRTIKFLKQPSFSVCMIIKFSVHQSLKKVALSSLMLTNLLSPIVLHSLLLYKACDIQMINMFLVFASLSLFFSIKPPLLISLLNQLLYFIEWRAILFCNHKIKPTKIFKVNYCNFSFDKFWMKKGIGKVLESSLQTS